jgi:hypothetical protein
VRTDEHVETECERCGEVRPCLQRSDPFLLDVYDETTRPDWWCDPCFVDRADQI